MKEKWSIITNAKNMQADFFLAFFVTKFVILYYGNGNSAKRKHDALAKYGSKWESDTFRLPFVYPTIYVSYF